jgi:hypothetical protein
MGLCQSNAIAQVPTIHSIIDNKITDEYVIIDIINKSKLIVDTDSKDIYTKLYIYSCENLFYKVINKLYDIGYKCNEIIHIYRILDDFDYFLSLPSKSHLYDLLLIYKLETIVRLVHINNYTDNKGNILSIFDILINKKISFSVSFISEVIECYKRVHNINLDTIVLFRKLSIYNILAKEQLNNLITIIDPKTISSRDNIKWFCNYILLCTSPRIIYKFRNLFDTEQEVKDNIPLLYNEMYSKLSYIEIGELIKLGFKTPNQSTNKLLPKIGDYLRQMK